MISISELQPEDELDSVLALCRDFFTEYECHHEEFYDIDDLNDEDISGRFLRSIGSDNSATFIALIDDTIVGYAAVDVREQPPFYKVRRIGVVWGLMVAKDHRRKGVASGLLAEARARFRQKGIRYYTLYTSVANRGAIRFYERNHMERLHSTFVGQVGGPPD